MKHIIDKFQSIIINESFQRVDEDHILDIYLGKDIFSRYTLFYVSSEEPKSLSSSRLIQVNVGKRKDNKWGIGFTLCSDNFEDIFIHFCNDMIESSRSVMRECDGATFICNRYERWQNMLSKSNGEILSAEIIRGLIGEMFFLVRHLLPLYGEEIAINSWLGPMGADHDFVLTDKWYEIKTVFSGAENIKISSIEQLDDEQVGELVVIYLDKTSSNDNTGITIESIYEELIFCLTRVDLKNMIDESLLQMGYYHREEYSSYIYKFRGFDFFVVDKDFPCIRRSIVPKSVINAKYNLSLASIRDVKKG